MTSTDTSTARLNNLRTARLLNNLLVGEKIVVKTSLVRGTLTVVSVRRRSTMPVIQFKTSRGRMIMAVRIKKGWRFCAKQSLCRIQLAA